MRFPTPPSLSEQLFNPDEISLSAGLERTRDIQRNSGRRRRGEDERNAEIDGEAMWRREKSWAETVRRDKRGKKWVNHYFAFAFAGSDIDSRQPEGIPRSHRSLAGERSDGRAHSLSFCARRNSTRGTGPLKAHTDISFIKENTRKHRARFAVNTLIAHSPRCVKLFAIIFALQL